MGEAINKKRKLRFGQFILLGATIHYEYRGKGEYSPKKWYVVLPDDRLPPHQGYVAGPFKRRWEAVESGLKTMGIA